MIWTDIHTTRSNAFFIFHLEETQFWVGFFFFVLREYRISAKAFQYCANKLGNWNSML